MQLLLLTDRKTRMEVSYEYSYLSRDGTPAQQQNERQPQYRIQLVCEGIRVSEEGAADPEGEGRENLNRLRKHVTDDHRY